MVVINGVKYACDRCIRGHRVTTCSHMDQPLTMIKPKGRPTSQCHHCRELRKNKQLHIQCACGKKGKSGLSSPLCVCNKNHACNCYASHRQNMKKSKNKIEEANNEHIESSPHHQDMTHVNQYLPNDASFEDIIAHPEPGSGLFDFLYPDSLDSKAQSSESGNHQHNKDILSQYSSDTGSNSIRSTGDMTSITKKDIDSNMNYDESIPGLQNPVNQEVNDYAAENQFPLFPLVGAYSFDNSKDRPLTPIPHEYKAKIERSLSSNHGDFETEQNKEIINRTVGNNGNSKVNLKKLKEAENELPQYPQRFDSMSFNPDDLWNAEWYAEQGRSYTMKFDPGITNQGNDSSSFTERQDGVIDDEKRYYSLFDQNKPNENSDFEINEYSKQFPISNDVDTAPVYKDIISAASQEPSSDMR